MESEQTRQIKENLKIKFRALNQIYDLTKELDAAFADGDSTSLDMLLDMRMNQIQMCLDANERNDCIFNELGIEEKDLSAKTGYKEKNSFQDEDIKEINNLVERIDVILNKTKKLDKIVMNKLENLV